MVTTLLYGPKPKGDIYLPKIGCVVIRKLHHPLPQLWWHPVIWIIKCPLKCKILFWLISTNHVPVWEFLSKKNWEGLDRCPLYKAYNESINRLFLFCSYTKHVWDHIGFLWVLLLNGLVIRFGCTLKLDLLNYLQRLQIFVSDNTLEYMERHE